MSSFFTEEELTEMRHAGKMVELMAEKNISIEQLSWHVHFTGQEIYEVMNELSYKKELVDEAISFLENSFLRSNKKGENENVF
ncbi:hypothetical protein [Macrococcus sp. DPC7161]|uniref:hypothetical protein n=1 Tax=Macrococcus sp. DPC7161 TaxID=2507060 RepID=UPI00100A9FDF|nr:hypothetical protein [Macrococcus sp. DPC7161]RXK19076.1 hypothetical protein ER639_01820 [Macrococcus sp. DPC7161]